MRSLITFLLTVTVIYGTLVESTTITCNFGNSENFKYASEPTLYNCHLSIPFEDFHTIDSATVEHLSGKTNDDVQGLIINSISNLGNFPKNIEKVFKNLIAIEIFACDLTEIHGDDLKVFPQLKYLSLDYNKLKTLSANTFASNPNLEVLILNNNEIYHVDRQAFAGLNKLRVLIAHLNTCFSLYKAENAVEVKNMIKKIENGDCENPENKKSAFDSDQEWNVDDVMKLFQTG